MHPIQVQNETVFTNPSAPPGKSQQYAKRERERRFLLAELPAGEIERTTTISDRYFLGTRLRLRLMLETRGVATRTYYKLTQKIPAPNGGPGLLSTTYLNEEEFALLSTLPGSVLRKTRYSIPPFGVDVFDAPLGGLILAECEFDDTPRCTRSSHRPGYSQKSPLTRALPVVGLQPWTRGIWRGCFRLSASCPQRTSI